MIAFYVIGFVLMFVIAYHGMRDIGGVSVDRHA